MEFSKKSEMSEEGLFDKIIRVFAYIAILFLLIFGSQSLGAQHPNDVQADADTTLVTAEECLTFKTFTNVGAMDESTAPLTCGSFWLGVSDIWTTIKTPGTTGSVFVEFHLGTSNIDLIYQIVEVSNPSTQVACGSMSSNSSQSETLSANSEYYIRMYDNGNNNTGTFELAFTSSSISQVVATTNETTPISCFGQENGQVSASVSGGTGPYTYTWSNGETTPAISNLDIGPYWVDVTDATGCIVRSDTTTLLQPQQLAINMSIDREISCRGADIGNGPNASDDGTLSASVSGGTGPYTYTWSNGETTPSIDSLAAGTYSVTITDNNGCWITDDLFLPQAELVDPSLVVDTVFVNAETMTATVSMMGFDNLKNDLTYVWTYRYAPDGSLIEIQASGNGNVFWSDQIESFGTYTFILESSELLSPFGVCYQPYGGIVSHTFDFYPDCPTLNEITDPINNGETHEEYGESITVNTTVSNNSHLMTMGNEVQLMPGMEIETGSTYEVQIGDCPGSNGLCFDNKRSSIFR